MHNFRLLSQNPPALVKSNPSIIRCGSVPTPSQFACGLQVMIIISSVRKCWKILTCSSPPPLLSFFPTRKANPSFFQAGIASQAESRMPGWTGFCSHFCFPMLLALSFFFFLERRLSVVPILFSFPAPSEVWLKKLKKNPKLSVRTRRRPRLRHSPSSLSPNDNGASGAARKSERGCWKTAKRATFAKFYVFSFVCVCVCVITPVCCVSGGDLCDGEIFIRIILCFFFKPPERASEYRFMDILLVLPSLWDDPRQLYRLLSTHITFDICCSRCLNRDEEKQRVTKITSKLGKLVHFKTQNDLVCVCVFLFVFMIAISSSIIVLCWGWSGKDSNFVFFLLHRTVFASQKSPILTSRPWSNVVRLGRVAKDPA